MQGGDVLISGLFPQAMASVSLRWDLPVGQGCHAKAATFRHCWWWVRSKYQGLSARTGPLYSGESKRASSATGLCLENLG